MTKKSVFVDVVGERVKNCQAAAVHQEDFETETEKIETTRQVIVSSCPNDQN
jgi:hypothetical protein